MQWALIGYLFYGTMVLYAIMYPSTWRMDINATFIAFNRNMITLKRAFLWLAEAGQFICWPGQQWRHGHGALAMLKNEKCFQGY